ncbi:hypothetical protein PSI9734_02111 [Pseudidiomarina piscicola]|uniref:DUF2970 domain-containing protein n=1 Tax=Pseudidiomarina piscicola TaxID=2614830 RepID=A0A6S6WR98_9GAMM|nr:DUF2970 domain-containing protein [Pseudidiomarina piscicola]CAB0151743.1 hypothetical protein PSI9734_02111 [Pseudidiomarina piscicola]VZT41200.1 hypothetical protein PSI9734_02111 [Pseudomonas aeruginosa]
MSSDSKPGVFSIILSVLAALFGVQTETNRQRDFTQGHPGIFIGVGIGFIVLFVVSLLLIVNWVLP